MVHRLVSSRTKQHGGSEGVGVHWKDRERHRELSRRTPTLHLAFYGRCRLRYFSRSYVGLLGWDTATRHSQHSLEGRTRAHMRCR